MPTSASATADTPATLSSSQDSAQPASSRATPVPSTAQPAVRMPRMRERRAAAFRTSAHRIGPTSAGASQRSGGAATGPYSSTLVSAVSETAETSVLEYG